MNNFFLDDVLEGYENTPVLERALRFCLRNPYESIIVVDKQGRIEFMDRGSEKFCGLEQSEAVGKQICELFPDSILPTVAETGVPKIGRIFNVAGEKKIGSVYPLIKNGEVIGALGRVVFSSFEEVERIKGEIDCLRKEIYRFKKREQHECSSIYGFDNIIGESPAILEAVQIAKKISSIGTDVMIIGESGTGKELFAHSLHTFDHHQEPFVRINCPAIPLEIAESELFGYEKGTFSGALATGKAGKFEIANNGTVFLDEIASLPLSIQAKLLRVLQEREFERLGSTKTHKVNFRLIATTNMDLKTLVNQGKFRDDLYYRIAKAIIHIPPLRERRMDIPLYVHHFLKRANDSFGSRVRSVSDRAMYYFMNYRWPGNVRELINLLEQGVLRALNDEELLTAHLPEELCCSQHTEGFVQPFSSTLIDNKEKTMKGEIEKKEKDLILYALSCTNGNKAMAASFLNMPRSSFYEKMKRYHISFEMRPIF